MYAKTPQSKNLPCDYEFDRVLKKVYARSIVKECPQFKIYIDGYVAFPQRQVSRYLFWSSFSPWSLVMTYVAIRHFFSFFDIPKSNATIRQISNLKFPQRWPECYRNQVEGIAGIRTNNGVEVLNHVIKRIVLRELMKGRICEVLRELIDFYLEDIKMRMEMEVTTFSSLFCLEKINSDLGAIQSFCPLLYPFLPRCLFCAPFCPCRSGKFWFWNGLN